MDIQFYPTPLSLARRAWKKFRNEEFVRVLDPSAGDGALLQGNPWAGYSSSMYGRQLAIDGIEIDVSKHPTLRAKHVNVVGTDFLQLSSATIYSHIILNPPFMEGAKHVLHAWNVLWDGEIVAIINAETLRNPFSAERAQLVKLIERYGEAEFIDGAFMVPEAQRKSEVDIALVYLRKKADVAKEIVGQLLTDLRREQDTAKGLSAEFEVKNELALADSLIENSVLAFNAAVTAMRDSVFATARLMYYRSLIGETMAVRLAANDGESSSTSSSVAYVQKAIADEYSGLKDRAWTAILRSTNVTSRLSSAAQRRIEAEFEQIKQLEFTVQNIYGFLCGLVEGQGKIQVEMACDVFDAITRYHTENSVFYKGWKSNDKHRTCGMRIKATRFILPHARSYSTCFAHETSQLMADFDKVFAMLDGKKEAEVSLVQAASTHFDDLRRGKRITSSYFDLRWYPGATTLHFFPKSKALVDRLNRLVGRQRSWLPPEGARVSEAFWLQFEKAEQFDKEVRAEVAKSCRSRYDDPLHGLFCQHEEDYARPRQILDNAMSKVLEAHGIDVNFQIEQEEGPRLLAA